MEIEKIAQVIGKMDSGGVESFIMSYYKNIDRNKIQFDFIVDEDSTMFYKDEVEKLGGRIIVVPKYQHIFKYIKQLRKVFRENKYNIIHAHINTLNVIPLYVAKKENIKVRISHNHSTTHPDEFFRNILKTFLKKFSKLYPTNYCACSKYAGKWIFGKKEFKIISNAIDVKKFSYNKEIREKIRKELNIENKLVLGHVGRFMQQKNHEFIIKVFYEYYKENKNSILIFVGDGKLEDKIKLQVKQLKLEKNVLFLGTRKDVNDIMQAMDLFLFPSLYEGLGIALVEAQTSGLPCIISPYVPEEAVLTPLVKIVPLNIKDWVKTIKDINIDNRISNEYEIKAKGYDINIESKKLEKYYLKLLQK